MARRRVLALVLIAAALGIMAVSVPTSPRPGRATFDQVRVGMIYDEVVATLGGPPGNYLDPDEGSVFSVRGAGYWDYKRWTTRDGALLVYFHEGRVVDITEDRVFLNAKPSLWERVQTWLGW